MQQLNENYSNGNNVAVLSTSARETSKVQVFNSPLFGEIRVIIDRKGEPLFCLVDICTSIGIINHRNVKNRLDADDVRLVDTTDNLGRTQQVTYVTESGMYDVILRSDSPKAKPFKKWVTGDVLPNIRKTGSYSIHSQYNIPQSFSEALQLAADQAKQIEEQQQQIAQKDAKIAKIQPKSDFADAAFEVEGKVDIGMSAKILNLGFGRNTLFDKLRKAGVFFANRNEPKQRFIDAGYFEMKEKFIERDNHPGFVVTKILVTQKGLAYINHLFGGNPSDGKLAAIR